jgi:N-acetylglucosaminyldiphosphoundecaprenol N-acetyl-beta-D-mannosaminyltransferase
MCKNFEKADILGAKIANLTVDEVIGVLLSPDLDKESQGGKRAQCVFTPNSEIIERFRKKPELMELLNSADILTADGIGVVIASEILKRPLKGRAAGFDIAVKLLEAGRENGMSFFFFGGREGIAEKAKANLEAEYPGLKIAGLKSGYGIENAAEEIAASGADVIFVCLGMEKQERWIFENKNKFPGAILLGIGGSLDVFAGEVKRAPKIFIKLNCEWLYRLLKQPSRFIRMLALPRFLFAVIVHKFKRGS